MHRTRVRSRAAACALALGLSAAPAAPAHADIKFTRLSDDQFIVHHRKKTRWGAEAKATRTAYVEAASICVAAGYTHMEIKDMNIGERTFGFSGRGASADVRVELHLDPTPSEIDEADLIACAPLAEKDKVEKARKKLRND